MLGEDVGGKGNAPYGHGNDNGGTDENTTEIRWGDSEGGKTDSDLDTASRTSVASTPIVRKDDEGENEEEEEEEYEEAWSEGCGAGTVGSLWEACWYFMEDPFGLYPNARVTLTHYKLTLAAKCSAITTLLTIIASTVFSVFQSLPTYYPDRDRGTMAVLETAFIGYFTLELFIRFLFIPDKLDLIVQITPLFDLLAVIPFYVGLVSSTLPFNLRILKLVRGTAILRNMRMSEGIETNVDTIHKAMAKSNEVLVLYLSVLAVSLIVWSSAIYYIEKADGTRWDDNLNLLIRNRREGDGWVEEVSPFQSIPHSLWWCIATVTTVGYGDDVPYSYGGKIVAGFTMISGIFVLALPTSILGSNFLCVYRDKFRTDDAHIKPAASDSDKMGCVVYYLDQLTEAGTLSRRASEYAKRAFWCPEYRRRLMWAYRAAMLVDHEEYEKCAQRLRYVGLVQARCEVKSPEVRERYGFDLRCSARLVEGTYISFCVGKEIAWGIKDIRDVRLLPNSLNEEAGAGVKEGAQHLWRRLFSPRPHYTEECREQESLSLTLSSIEAKRAVNFVRIVSIIINFIEEVSSKDAKPLSSLFKTAGQ